MKQKINILVSTEAQGLEFYEGFWSPLFFHKKLFENLNLNIKFFHRISDSIFNCQFLILSSRYFKQSKNIIDKEGINFLKEAREKKVKLVWFDLRDSAGTTNFEVLRYVHMYFKKQLYSDLDLYKKNFYGGRIYSDYYYKKFKIRDHENYNYIKLKDSYKKKIFLSWNIGVRYFDFDVRNKLLKLLNYYLFKFKNQRNISFSPHSMNREYNLICTYGKNIYRNSVRFQREYFEKFIEKNHKLEDSILFKKIPIKSYYNNLKSSKVLLSLYGWGEICYREFEAVINGCPFIMPNMSHIKTYPNIYKSNETYIPINWDFSDFYEKYALLLNNYKLRKKLVINAQNEIKNIRKTKGYNYFKTIFEKIIE